MIPWRNLRRFFYKALKQPEYAFKVFKRRFTANLYYLFASGKSSPPEAITLFLTHRCNLQCKMCGQWGEGGVTRKQSTQYIQNELTTKEMISIIDDVTSFKPNITLFGGEPLLYPGCIEIIRYIKLKGMHCLMITNGSLLERVAEDIVDSGLDELNVSLDGNRELHDQIRGTPGLFDRIIKGLDQVQFFKSIKKKKKPLINLQCTINKYNYQHLEQLINVANLVKTDSLTFHNLIFLERSILEKQKIYDNLLNCSSLDWEGFVFEPGIDPSVLYEKIRQIPSAKYRFSVDFYPNFSYQELKQYYRESCFIPHDYCSRCLSPWLVAYIFPDGQVKPCLNSSYSFGTIKEQKFTEVWNSQKAEIFRNVLKKNKIFPVCVRCTELYRY
jgi:radical SAM protein with 4Fe4S-binding SPASM domain